RQQRHQQPERRGPPVEVRKGEPMPTCSAGRRTAALVAAASLILLSPGLEPYRVLAQIYDAPAAAWSAPMTRFLAAPGADPSLSPSVHRLNAPERSPALRASALRPVLDSRATRPLPAEPAAQEATVAQALAAVVENDRTALVSETPGDAASLLE